MLLHKPLRTVAITATFIYEEHRSASGSMRIDLKVEFWISNSPLFTLSFASNV
jgi:hypothetical protein